MHQDYIAKEMVKIWVIFLEFKSELQISVDFVSNSQLGFSYNHLSNASLGTKNPGANSYMFNFFKTF